MSQTKLCDMHMYGTTVLYMFTFLIGVERGGGHPGVGGAVFVIFQDQVLFFEYASSLSTIRSAHEL